MRSKVAEALREEQIEEVRRMTPSERVALARGLRERGLDLYMAGQSVDRATALKAIRRDRQGGRRYSRCMDEST
jgi:hypothetical protein